MLEYVFVYGSLRQNERNHHLIDGAELVSEQAYVCGQLWNTGNGYPTVILDPHDRVYGELYRINTSILRKLDALEGYHGPDGPNLYERVEETVHTDQKTYDAYIYVYPSSPEHGTHLKSGDWKVENRLKEEPLLYFAFGSCMDDERFQLHDVDHLFQDVLGCGVLDNYELKFTLQAMDGLGRADIVESKGGRVEGVLYSINHEAVEYLYEREGVADQAYRPTFVNVKHNGTMLEDAMTFTVIHKRMQEIPPPEKYAEEILRGAKDVVSDEYYEQLQIKLRNLLSSNKRLISD